MKYGNRKELSFEIDHQPSESLCEVDIWIGGMLITYSDNVAYLPGFIHSLKREVKNLKSGVIDEECSFLNHGPTTDDVSCRAEFIGESLILKGQLAEGEGFAVNLPREWVISTYEECIGALDVLAT
ncbi:hypothetical protein [Ferrimonas balearica]|uniref:hypothetical protein n=1 Tax=Ferrimonas balearica TaxID=44012 RepID=UPI001C9A2643|nr:hypothetical protein [Ferrimonas balearica]MBY5990896.1 hypothetical protein [Ferrimonas balearica]